MLNSLRVFSVENQESARFWTWCDTIKYMRTESWKHNSTSSMSTRDMLYRQIKRSTNTKLNINLNQQLNICIYMHQALPPPLPPWAGSHILAPYEIFPLPPLWCGGGVALSPSPLWCGGGVVWYVGYVWCVWPVWYGMFGKYGMSGRYGMYGWIFSPPVTL